MVTQADRDTMVRLQIDSHYAFNFAAEAKLVAFGPFVVAEHARRDSKEQSRR